VRQIIDLYLDLMKRCLTDSIYGDDKAGPDPQDPSFDGLIRFKGAPAGQWPSHAHTMIGLERLDNIRECLEGVLAEGVAGDLIETGVWRGGATIFMRAVLKAHGVADRTVWVADSFSGLPQPDRKLARSKIRREAGKLLGSLPENLAWRGTPALVAICV